MKKYKILEGKSCVNCVHGITIPPFPYECSFMIDGEWVHEGGYCPKEMICKNWEVNPITGMADSSDMWRRATVITVE